LEGDVGKLKFRAKYYGTTLLGVGRIDTHKVVIGEADVDTIYPSGITDCSGFARRLALE
jgi:hypothetical protein